MADATGSVDHGGLKNAPMPSRSAMVRWLLGLVVLGTVGLSVLGLAGRHGWLLDLCNHFRFQYALVLAVTSVGLTLLRSWRVGLVSLAGLALNLAVVVPLYFPASGSVELQPDAPLLRVMHYNINTANTDEDGVIGEILANKPDVVFVQEVNRRWLAALDQGLLGYKQVASEPRSDNFGIACYARSNDAESAYTNPLSITSSRSFDPTAGVAQVPVIEVFGRFDDRPIAILSIHPVPPVSADYHRARNATMRAAGEWAAEMDAPCIVVGDFNATPWSAAFAELVDAGGLVNSQRGHGRCPTWPAGALSLGMIPIDHLLHSFALVTAERSLGPANGSDHLPLVVELAWAAN